jgi:VacB/RNase II family 3'-5' exoribonuclease
MGELPIETEALLTDAGVTWSEFAEDVLQDLPPTPWTIPDSEIRIRRDFRQDNVFSIDPLTAKDLDDAISVKRLPNNLYEVGVHIADVSHFVQPGTALDNEAFYRATTVYLVQKAIPMLPRLLCEELCSLNPGVDRFAFSVTWTFNTEGEVVGEPWFGKSIICSRGKLAYEHAQAIIEGKTWDHLPPVQLSPGTTFQTIQNDVLFFYELSQKLRKKRYENGALSFQSIKLWFALDELGNPMDSGVYQIKDSNRLIEEVRAVFFMKIFS